MGVSVSVVGGLGVVCVGRYGCVEDIQVFDSRFFYWFVGSMAVVGVNG